MELILDQASGYGNHIPGQSSACAKNGIYPLRFETFRKSLGKLQRTTSTCFTHQM